MFARQRLALWLATLLLVLGGVSLGFAYVDAAEATASPELLADIQAAVAEAQALPESETAEVLNFLLPTFTAGDDRADPFAPSVPVVTTQAPNTVAQPKTTSATPHAQSPAALANWPNTTAETNLASPAAGPPTTGKWIDVNLSKQRVTAYIDSKPVKTVSVSTGTRIHPTVVGTYRVYAKIPKQRMTGGSRARGDYYSLPNVPNVMYFYRGYALHGTYWHKNFGRPMSHGCVNLTLADAKWFYDWTPNGTIVYSHY